MILPPCHLMLQLPPCGGTSFLQEYLRCSVDTYITLEHAGGGLTELPGEKTLLGPVRVYV